MSPDVRATTPPSSRDSPSRGVTGPSPAAGLLAVLMAPPYPGGHRAIAPARCPAPLRRPRAAGVRRRPRTCSTRPSEAQSRKPCWSGPTFCMTRWSKPASAYSLRGGQLVVQPRAARELPADVVHGDGLAGRLEVDGVGQLGHDLPAGERPAAGLPGGLRGGLLGLGPGHRHLGVARPGPAGRLEQLVDLGLGLGGEQPVAELGGQRGRRLPAARDRDQGQRLRQVEDAGVLQLQVAAVVGLVAALPEQPDDLQRLAEHRVADLDRGEAGADDVLVEPLARPDAQHEAAVAEQGRGRGRLGDDRRVVAHGGAGHPGGQADPARSSRPCCPAPST